MPVEAPGFAIVTGQPVPEGIKPVYLPDLMAETNRVPSTLEWIQALLQREVGAGLPQALIEQLGFAKLRWQLVYNRHSLPYLFVGVPTTQVGPIELAEAAGTIYLVRGGRNNLDDNVFVSDLGVAGVGRVSNGSTRVLTAQYSPSHKQAYTINVSVSPQEFPPPPPETSSHYEKYSNYRYHYCHVARPIPSTPHTVYHIGGIVTARMVLETAVNGQDAHERVLSSYDSTHQGNRVLPLDHGRLSRILGFTVESLDNLHRVSYHPPRETAPALTAWQVEFPKKLG